MGDRISLRVHAAAPSSRADDRRFQAQAEAYASFAPASKRSLAYHHVSEDISDVTTAILESPRERSQPNTIAMDIIPPIPSTYRDDTTEIAWDPTTFLEDTQLGYSALESQLITSSLRVAKSARKRSVKVADLEPDAVIQQKVRSSFEHSSDAFVKSAQQATRRASLDTTPLPNQANKRAKLDGAKIHNTDFGHTSSIFTGRRVDTSPGKAIEPHSAQASVSESPAGPVQSSYLATPALYRTKEIAKSEPVTPRGSKSKGSPRVDQKKRIVSGPHVTKRRGEDSQGLPHQGLSGERPSQYSSIGDDVTSELPTSYSLSDITSGSSRNRQHSSVQRSATDPGPAARNSGETSSLEKSLSSTAQGIHNKASSSKVSPVVVKDFAVDATTTVPLPNPGPAAIPPTTLTEPTSIRPPPPDVGLGSFQSQVTPPLKYLVESPKLCNTYKPLSIARELRATERGHWLLDIASWAADVQTRFFQYIEPMIADGRFGWGVWCTRGADGLGADVVKVYCWGEVVEHIYLVLYVASMSQVRKLGMRWVDAEGNAVVKMRSSGGEV